MSAIVRTVLAAVLALTVPGCGGEDRERPLTVLAAASLTDAFAALADEFEASHPGVGVEVITASSTDLAGQAADGAPGDVLATADPGSMRLAVDGEATASEPRRFATNTLVLVTPPGNPEGVRQTADLAGTTWVRCAPQVPCGRAADATLDTAGVDATPVSLEPDVRATLERVTSGGADAGLVYASDATSAGDDVEAITLDDAASTDYLIAPLVQSERRELADDWIDLVVSERGRAALSDAGFGLP